ncbi:MAG: hypothetical protein ACYTGG_07280 [Planctomycetota bacterium]|jgi:hypothetical protein
MKALVLVVAGSALFIGSAASGQSLSERIAHFQRSKMQEEARNTSKAHMLSTLLYTDLTVDFQERPVREVVDYLRTVLKINIVARYSDDRVGFGIDPEALITLQAEQQPALTILEQVLEQAADLDPTTWQLRKGFVEIGTKERLSVPSAREIRYYPIRDLLFEVPRFDNAPELDIDTALNQGGGGGGGRGGGGGGGGGGFGGGGGGGSGGGGSGGGGGGGIFGSPDEGPDRVSEEDKAQEIIDIIVETVEPEAWDILGGEFATIRYYQGTLIVRAPDYIHRQIGGYPFALRPPAAGAVSTVDSRYVTFSGGYSNVQLKDIREYRTSGSSAGGSRN